jgi:Uma2 family endonuclease
MSEITLAAPVDRSEFSLHPEDQVTQQDSHDEQCTYLKQALRQVLPDWFVGRELAVYWVPGQRQFPYAGPDVLVARRRPAQESPTVFLTYEDGPLTLVGEVASEGTRAGEESKRDTTYATALRVPEYLYIDLNRAELQLWLLEEGRYRQLPSDEHGRLWSPALGVGFGWQEDRRLVRVVTPEGRVIPTGQEEVALRAAAEQRAEQEALRAERQRRRADREKQRADQEAAQRAAAEEHAEQLVAELERLRKALDGNS